jgi:hypothetical protein
MQKESWTRPLHNPLKGIRLYKLFFVLCCLVIVGNTPVCAQDDDYFYIDPDEKEDLELGLRMGYGINTFAGDLLRNTRPLFAFTGGVYHRYPLNKSKTISLYHEVGFSFKGAKFKETSDSAFERFALIYLDLPVGFETIVKRVKTPNRGYQVVRVFAGVQASVLLRSTLFRNMDKTLGSETALPLTTMDYALVLGVPVELPLEYGKMGFSTYLKYGYHNIDGGLRERYMPLPNFGVGSRLNSIQLAFNVTF